jgi:ABC-type multidrug transport system ATPase subunit
LIEAETEKMLNDLTLEKKSDSFSTELSGGMKRKLSIAIAFIGNSTTVILDEPTAGINIFSFFEILRRKYLKQTIIPINV